MPFTAAHPAIVLPLVPRFARLRAGSALVIGTMVPDIVYFLPWPRPSPGYGSHSLAGLLAYCLPVGLTAVIGYEAILRKPLESLLPPAATPTTTARSTMPAPLLRTAVAVVMGVFLGALTHIGWDLLANPNGALLRRIPLATANLLTVGGYRFYLYRIAEHVSTLLGLCAIAWVATRSYLARRSRASGPIADPGRRFRTTSLVSIMLCALAGAAYGASLCDLCDQWRPADWLQTIRFSLNRAVVWGGRTGALALGVYCLAWFARRALTQAGGGAATRLYTAAGDSR